jgi:hypothetical protein
MSAARGTGREVRDVRAVRLGRIPPVDHVPPEAAEVLLPADHDQLVPGGEALRRLGGDQRLVVPEDGDDRHAGPPADLQPGDRLARAPGAGFEGDPVDQQPADDRLDLLGDRRLEVGAAQDRPEGAGLEVGQGCDGLGLVAAGRECVDVAAA